ncbi:MAG: ATP-binding protein [Firmicutes bacterium]|nr:ATP-binding protein [Bacillota bacterium]
MPRLSIRAKFLLITGLLVLGATYLHTRVYPKQMERQIRAQALQSARQVAETASSALSLPLAMGNAEEIAKVLEGVKNIPAFHFSAVYDDRGRQIDATPSTPIWAKHYSLNEGRSQALAHPGPEALLVSTAPIFFREPYPNRVGTLVLGFTTEEIQKAVNQTMMLGMMQGLTLTALAVGIFFVLGRFYIRPLQSLTMAAQQVAQGRLDGERVVVSNRDELGDLSHNFNMMTDRLRASRHEIREQNRLLESRVEERTGQLMETIQELEETRANLEGLVLERTRGLEQSRAEISAWADSLEEKVQMKTVELTEMNEHLLDSFQKLQQVDRLKDEFLANMSHELRTPLNAVIGFSGMLLKEGPERVPPDVRGDLEIILGNGRTLLGMIDSILDLSKIEAGKFEIDQVVFDPLPLLEEVKKLAVGLIQDRSIRFSYEPPAGEVQKKVLGDPQRLKQVFVNLVGNAIKFTEEGEVSVTAQYQSQHFAVAIRDTGIGMSDEDMTRLFRPFQQVDGSITRRFGGTGLGLALSQRLVKLMGGQIRVESRKGRGSTFTVELPLHASGAP